MAEDAQPQPSAAAQLRKALAAVDPSADLAARLDALEDVARWFIEIPTHKRLTAPAPHQLKRLRALMELMRRDSAVAQKIAQTLASVLRDTTGVPLFSEAGLPGDRGLATETLDRVARRVLPQPPDDENLERFVSRVFRAPRDCAWINEAPPELFAELGALLGDIWTPLRDSMADAIALLCTRVSALGLSPDLRERGEQVHVRDSPFFRLPHVPLEELPMLILECRQQLGVIHERLETTGVSVDVVFRIDAIRRMLVRLERMYNVLEPSGNERERARASQILVGALTAGRIADDSLRQLGRQNLGLLARKIIERVGHSGEHYVTSTRKEYFRMLASAAGGGAITAFTVIGKFMSKWAHFAPFIDGLLAWGNYAASFLVMQFLGLTLATKQPSMTAAKLAATIRETKGEHQLDDLVILIARISRSQFAAAVGNVFTVIPCAMFLDLACINITGHHFLDAAAAASTIDSFHPLHTGTIFFASVTGVLLWMSSIGAGWLENWVTYRRLPEAIRHHRIGKTVGKDKLGKIADFISEHTAGIGGNVTLGFLLAMVPVFGGFFGLPLEVRHITLSTGSLAFSACALGPGAITLGAVIGIALVGLLNFGVSFALALAVALRAREVTGKEQLSLARGVLRRFARKPHLFFFPPKNERAVTQPLAT